jgi:hypothetical protein
MLSALGEVTSLRGVLRLDFDAIRAGCATFFAGRTALEPKAGAQPWPRSSWPTDPRPVRHHAEHAVSNRRRPRPQPAGGAFAHPNHRQHG